MYIIKLIYTNFYTFCLFVFLLSKNVTITMDVMIMIHHHVLIIKKSSQLSALKEERKRGKGGKERFQEGKMWFLSTQVV